MADDLEDVFPTYTGPVWAGRDDGRVNPYHAFVTATQVAYNAAAVLSDRPPQFVKGNRVVRVIPLRQHTYAPEEIEQAKLVCDAFSQLYIGEPTKRTAGTAMANMDLTKEEMVALIEPLKDVPMWRSTANFFTGTPRIGTEHYYPFSVLLDLIQKPGQWEAIHEELNARRQGKSGGFTPD